MSQYERKTIEELIDGTIDSYKLKEMLSNFKDADRFEKYISILQDTSSMERSNSITSRPALVYCSKTKRRQNCKV